MLDFVVDEHQSDEFDSFDPDCLEVFEEVEIHGLIEITEKDDLDGYVEEEDEDFLVNESELGSESESSSSEEEEPLDLKRFF
jgi:hypothetical protein